MSKFSKYLLISLVLLFTGCNRPQGKPVLTSTEPAIPPLEISTETSTAEPAEDLLVTDTPQPGGEDAVPSPEIPTVDMTQALSGDLIPVFPAGTKITIHEIQIMDDLGGWAVAVSDPETDHVLRTSDGGLTWQDVTPPQPQVTGDPGLTTANLGIWNADTAWVNYSGSDLIWVTRNKGLDWNPTPVIYDTLSGAMFFTLDENHVWVFQFLDAGMQKVYTAVDRTTDGGVTWELLLDPYTDISIQSFDKTGLVFINPQYGWLTRDFRGVSPFVHLDVTRDGGTTWDAVEIPPPASLPDVFQNGACGLYDPSLISTQVGSFRLSCLFFDNDQRGQKDFLYKTRDGGITWNVLDTPGGKISYISDQIIFAISRDIYRSADGGLSWQKVRSVNWDGQFSFISEDTAWVVAHNPDTGMYALVRTSDGGNSFAEIKPGLTASPLSR